MGAGEDAEPFLLFHPPLLPLCGGGGGGEVGGGVRAWPGLPRGGAAVLYIHGPSMTKSACSPPPSPSWVGYQKAGFRGHQYLLEEGEYADWSHWGGYDEALTSLRVIRTVSKGNWAIPLPGATAILLPPHQVQSVEGRVCSLFPSSPEYLEVFLRSSLMPSCCSSPGHTDRLTPKSPGGLCPRGLGTPRGFRGWAGET